MVISMGFWVSLCNLILRPCRYLGEIDGFFQPKNRLWDLLRIIEGGWILVFGRRESNNWQLRVKGSWILGKEDWVGKGVRCVFLLFPTCPFLYVKGESTALIIAVVRGLISRWRKGRSTYTTYAGKPPRKTMQWSKPLNKGTCLCVCSHSHPAGRLFGTYMIFLKGGALLNGTWTRVRE